MNKTTFGQINKDLTAYKAELIESVAAYVAEIKANVLPELWVMCGISATSLFVAGIDCPYTGTETDSILMLKAFNHSIPFLKEKYLEDARLLLDELEA